MALYNMYGQQPYTPQIQNPTTPSSPSNSLLWVQGDAGAKSWIVAPGQTVLLMDSEKEVFYIKSADMSGMPTLRAFEYKAIDNSAPVQSVEYATKDDIAQLNAKIEALSKPKKKKTEAENE